MVQISIRKPALRCHRGGNIATNRAASCALVDKLTEAGVNGALETRFSNFLNKLGSEMAKGGCRLIDANRKRLVRLRAIATEFGDFDATRKLMSELQSAENNSRFATEKWQEMKGRGIEKTVELLCEFAKIISEMKSGETLIERYDRQYNERMDALDSQN